MPTKKFLSTENHSIPGLLNEIREKLSQNIPIRSTISGFGRLHIDRQLPFLCVYRKPSLDDWGTSKLVRSEASHLVLTEDAANNPNAGRIFRSIAETLSQEFGGLLIVDVFANPTLTSPSTRKDECALPFFDICVASDGEIGSTVDALVNALEKIRIHKKKATIALKTDKNYIARSLSPYLNPHQIKKLHCFVLGLGVDPIYRDIDEKEVYPMVLRALRRGLSKALKRAFYDFTVKHTTRTPPNYLALGRRAFVKSVYRVDRELAEIDSSFDFLLQTTPINVDAAWNAFKRKKYDRVPTFNYRPLPFDPSIIKRKLFRIPIEKIEDPTLEHLLSQKQLELDQKLTLMGLIETKKFLYGSMELYGAVTEDLLKSAHAIIKKLPPAEATSRHPRFLSPRAFATLAIDEIEAYKEQWSEITAGVQVRNDMYGGLLVSQGNLLIGRGASIPANRAHALICHEIGTHIVTYFNGRAQPFQQLYTGLAGYDELQEGLGVLAEYLVGGFTRERLRTIAARVIAVDHLIRGANFLEIYRDLTAHLGFGERGAFQIAVRTCRAGGLTKDAAYLKGLIAILDYLKKGGDLDILYVGKIAREHVPLIRELQWRKVLNQMPLYPLFLKEPSSQRRLETLKQSGSIKTIIQDIME